MLAFVVQRLIQAIMVMVSVAFIAFLLFQYVGDPVLFMLGQDATADQIAALRKDLGLDQPFIVQFGHFLLNAVQGEFGISLRQGAKVSQLIADRFPATLELAVIAAGMALLLGIPMGVYAALKRGTLSSQLLMTFSLLGVSLPTFLIGILLILFFAVLLGWLPSFGRGDVVKNWLVEYRAAYRQRLATHCFASPHAHCFSAHPDHAFGTCRNVRSAAH